MFYPRVDVVGKVLKPKVIEIAAKNQQQWAGRQKVNLSPSTDFMCLKKTYLQIKQSGPNLMELVEDTDEFTYENERAKVVGNNFHDYIQSILKSTGTVRLCETTLIDEKYRIKARLDLVVEINSKLYLVELKSAQNYSVKLMKEEGAPNLEHIKQVQLYFHLYEENKNVPEIFEICKGRPLEAAIILYETRDKHEITEFLIQRNNNMIKELLRWCDMIWAHVAAGKAPNFKFSPDSPECLYKCRPQFYKLCHGKDRKDVKKADPIAVDTNIWGIGSARSVDPSEPGFI